MLQSEHSPFWPLGLHFVIFFNFTFCLRERRSIEQVGEGQSERERKNEREEGGKREKEREARENES